MATCMAIMVKFMRDHGKAFVQTNSVLNMGLADFATSSYRQTSCIMLLFIKVKDLVFKF